MEVGLRTEAIVTAELLRRGFKVLTPCGFNHRYDLVIDLDGLFVRVQCKTGRLRDGTVRFNSESVRVNSTRAVRRAYDAEAEIFIVYCPDTEQIYAVPVAGAPRREVTLRVDPTRNAQKEGVRWANDHILPA